MSVLLPSRPTDPDPRRWWALAVIALTQLVVVLDATIVNVALPQAQLELELSDTERQWVITAYVLAFGALLLLGGRVADYWGRKRSYMVGMLGFGAASAWGGLAQSGTELIAARGLQGVFAALLAPAALALLTVSFPAGRERGTAFAVFGTVAGTGAAVGLALGGVLTEFADWRWCLLVNIVFAVVGLVSALIFVSESRVEGGNGYDIWGTLAVTLGLAALVYGFTLAESGWTEPDTIGFLMRRSGAAGGVRVDRGPCRAAAAAAADRAGPRPRRGVPHPGDDRRRLHRDDPLPDVPPADRARALPADGRTREPRDDLRDHDHRARGRQAAAHQGPARPDDRWVADRGGRDAVADLHHRRRKLLDRGLRRPGGRRHRDRLRDHPRAERRSRRRRPPRCRCGIGPGQLRHADRWLRRSVGVHHGLPRRRRTFRRGRSGGRAAALTDGYSAVFLATAVTLVVAAVIAATMLRGRRLAATPHRPAEVPAHVG